MHEPELLTLDQQMTSVTSRSDLAASASSAYGSECGRGCDYRSNLTRERNEFLLPIALILGGASVGGMTVLLLSKGWAAEWVETASTWFGGIGTVLTLLWAIRVFRSDQSRRAQLGEEELEAAAAMIGVELIGGGGYGGSGEHAVEDVTLNI